jgi:hypothetical protein
MRPDRGARILRNEALGYWCRRGALLDWRSPGVIDEVVEELEA